MNNTLFGANYFQFCAKLVIFNHDFSQVLLCQRDGEEDFDQVFSFAGGKIENSDGDIRAGIKREKEEELGKECLIDLFKDFVSFEYYIKKNGAHMILPHFICVYRGGEIHLNKEYSSYEWCDVQDLAQCKLPLIDSIAPTVKKLLAYTDNETMRKSAIIHLGAT